MELTSQRGESYTYVNILNIGLEYAAFIGVRCLAHRHESLLY